MIDLAKCGLWISRAFQWRGGFVYLCAVVDWAIRKVLFHREPITMESDFCVEALEDVLAIHGKAEIFNTDQGSQFTSEAFTSVLKREKIRISIGRKVTGVITFFRARLAKH